MLTKSMNETFVEEMEKTERNVADFCTSSRFKNSLNYTI